ncbi:ScbA/BarX family gamma-butyrolactone biosynthesis protein [Streptomyces sp. HNM0574]|uniref:ScbA/BarX family gamma-butyrolactone biosynthesis protein n=1 Tax=Streptomyces sp. HNM0574 TaxID=2714954 RepID=UPI00146F71EC|nr:ScbA/BarX family gamma-butyrolactone biosynthesis protein [Streptomyces sp. HNM0574]NLU68706.1 AfsA/ScbA [Streptomyces sp. HNM0574]
MPAIVHTSDERTPATGPTTLPPGLVGKKIPGEVLITGWNARADGSYTVTARWPRSHRVYAPGDRTYSPMLFTETVRQSLALLTHAGCGVPLGHRMGWEYCHTRLVPAAMRVQRGSPGIELTVRFSGADARRGARSWRLTAEITVTRDGVPLGSASIHYTAHPPVIYDRLRGAYADAEEATLRALAPPPPVTPTAVGKTDGSDVVLSPTPDPLRWQLRADVTHHVFFDHAHDHIPGMVLLEAATQAARIQAGADRDAFAPVALHTEFSRYTELDAPCWIEATPLERTPDGHTRSRITGTQNDRTTFTTELTATTGH